jgi:uncharacterized OB-fold protein
MDAATPSRVLPRFPELDSQPFWEATKNRELRYQVCKVCAAVIFYPRGHCTQCTSLELEWRISAGAGTIYTYSIVRRAQHPAFKHLAPYVVAYVDLDERFRMLTNIVGVHNLDTDLKIGQRVTLDWIDCGSVCLPAFRPIAPGVER